MFLFAGINKPKVIQKVKPIEKVYAIKCVNRGMWGCTSLLHSNGKTITFDTKEEAQEEVDRIRKDSGYVNNFTEYFVTEIDKPNE